MPPQIEFFSLSNKENADAALFFGRRLHFLLRPVSAGQIFQKALQDQFRQDADPETAFDHRHDRIIVPCGKVNARRQTVPRHPASTDSGFCAPYSPPSRMR